MNHIFANMIAEKWLKICMDDLSIQNSSDLTLHYECSELTVSSYSKFPNGFSEAPWRVLRDNYQSKEELRWTQRNSTPSNPGVPLPLLKPYDPSRFLLISTESSNLTSPPLLRLSTFWPERMNSPWIWIQLQQNAFETLKHIKFFLCPNTPNPWCLLPLYNTDTSLLAAGTVLMQLEINGNLHSCAYFSKMFTPAERNYDSYNQELLPSSSPSINGVSTFGVPHTLSPLSHITKTSHRLRISEHYPINKLVGHCFYRTLTSCLDGPSRFPGP